MTREPILKTKTSSPEETFLLAASLARSAPPGTVLALSGDLGAGKTLFAKGLAKGLGVKNEVTSPTFTVMNIYEGGMRLVHFDLYRLESEDELEAVGFFEYADEPDGVVVIEWAEKFPDALPEDRIDVSISRGGAEGERIFALSPAGGAGVPDEWRRIFNDDTRY